MFDTSVVVIIQENVKFAMVLRFETISTAPGQSYLRNNLHKNMIDQHTNSVQVKTISEDKKEKWDKKAAQ